MFALIEPLSWCQAPKTPGRSENARAKLVTRPASARTASYSFATAPVASSGGMVSMKVIRGPYAMDGGRSMSPARRRLASDHVAQRPVHGLRHAAGVADADELEVRVVGAGGVEVDRADAQDALAQRLARVDVLDPVHARLLHALGEDAPPDVQPLVGDHVVGCPAPDHAHHEHQADQDHAHGDPDGHARRDRDDYGDHDRAEEPTDIEREHRPPGRMALEHDLLAGMHVHGAGS